MNKTVKRILIITVIAIVLIPILTVAISLCIALSEEPDITLDSAYDAPGLFDMTSKRYPSVYVSDTEKTKITLMWNKAECVFIGKAERDGEILEFVLLEKEDSFYALPVSHLAHMAHPSLFPDDECLKEPLFEGKTVYTNGLTELHITKDSAGIFGGDLPKITLSRFDKNEYFGKD